MEFILCLIWCICSMWTAHCKLGRKQELGLASPCFQCYQWWLPCREQACHAGGLSSGLVCDSFICDKDNALVCMWCYFLEKPGQNPCVHMRVFCVLQEFMILPVGAETFAEAMKMGTEVYHTLKVCSWCCAICCHCRYFCWDYFSRVDNFP